MTDPVATRLAQRLPDFVRDLEALVNQDSGTYDRDGVQAVNRQLEARLASLGFTVARIPSRRFGDHLVARKHGPGKARIMLLGHSDTVFPRGTAAQRPMKVVGDRIMGPGTCDMKGGLLAGIYALEVLQELGWDGFRTISWIIVSDEEVGDRDSIPLLLAEGAEHDAVLTLEAARDNGDIVTARKGVRWYTVEAVGKAAHAGVEPEKGASAVIALAHLVVQAAALNDPARGLTLNPGHIRSDNPPNVIAERASVRFDLRAYTSDEMDELEHRLQELADHTWVPGVTTTVTLEPGSECPPMPRTPGTAVLEQIAADIAGKLGFTLKGAATGGVSDINFATHRGTPGLDGLGPVGGLDHGPDEYILLSSVVPRTALLARLIEAIGREFPLQHRGAGAQV